MERERQIGPAMQAYLKFAAQMKQIYGPWSAEYPHDVAATKQAYGGDDKQQNTMARPDPGFFGTSGVNGVAGLSSFASVERPYVSTSAYPWDNERLEE